MINDSIRSIIIPNGRHVEELVRLPECFLCYTPSPEAGPVSPTPALANGFITFGSFNNLAKVLFGNHDQKLNLVFLLMALVVNLLLGPFIR